LKEVKTSLEYQIGSIRQK